MIKTKIIATLGPGSESPETIRALVDAGVDVFRLNFSHGTHEQHGRCLERLREACAEAGATAAVMADLCGPKIRVGRMEGGGFQIAVGAALQIVATEVIGTPERISTNRPEIVREAAVGHRLLID